MKNPLEGSRSEVKVSDIASNATHAHTFDTKGFSYASIDVAFEPVAAAGTNNPVAHVLTLQQSDEDNANFVAVPGFVAGTDYTLPTPANTTATTIVRLNVDLEAKKRFLRLNVTPRTDIALVSAVRLGVAESVPVDAAGAGVNVFVSRSGDPN
jgi:hypothetical protein